MAGREAAGQAPLPRWSLWSDLSTRAGALNMAIDQALLERAARRGEHWLRLYTWSPHCLSFGRHERALARYDRERIKGAGLDVVRRPTGGRAVWHARELTYAVAAPIEAMGGLRAAYLEIHRMLLEALRRLGADASLAAAATVPGLDAGACFARAVGGELVVGGQKVVGSAQVREGGGLLQHGSILLEDDQAVIAAMTRGAAPEDGSTALAGLVGRAIAPDEAAAAVADTAAERWGGSWDRGGAPDTLLTEAGAHLPRFGSQEWTWRA
ncbi:MAG: hypothetical protein H0W29_08540 [Gemmatimonadales bacterium]|nr:hypothetical protein [Gemmatimonadales bacterium]